jgi:glutathione synthase/RimK-type ligase-like ATP-grasp enzyme
MSSDRVLFFETTYSATKKHKSTKSAESVGCSMIHEKEPGILVAGGDTDPNLAAILRCLENRGLTHEALLIGKYMHPRVTWDLDNDKLLINAQERSPSALFIRNDVFTGLAAGRPEPFQRAMAWFTTILGWALSHPQVRILNRDSALNLTNKLHVLRLAHEVGFEIPSTLVSNDFELLSAEMEKRQLIVKPVNGGDYTKELREALEIAPVLNSSLASPAIIQERLTPPEIRVYRIGQGYFPYQLVADALDYRSISDCQVIPLELSDLPEGLIDRLGALMDRLQMNFGAADFKASPQTKRLLILEINNSPMFAAFDAVSQGRLTNAMVDFLSQ